MNIHLIAIGGSAMHNLALALHLKGYVITGSDDQIFEPSKSRLAKHNLLPKKIGWNPNLISKKIDAVIVGMHAKKDNPELLKAKTLNLNIFSYPEYIYEQSKKKKRVVIGGSHGKTSITAMILHVLQNLKIDCDYMVGAQLKGFDVMVKLTDDAPIIILEGDEYLSSPIDRRPKFHLYQPHIGVLSGIAWDHINVFPTFENYIKQFHIFAESIQDEGALIFCEEDENLNDMVNSNTYLCKLIPYSTHKHIIEKSNTFLIDEQNNRHPIEIFGIHNLQNLKAAQLVCEKIGIDKIDFYKSVEDFKGASKRMELVKANDHSAFYKDFAHSPSKLKATTSALKNQFPARKLVACMELHTFSSLNAEFLKLYSKSMLAADIAYVYYNLETIKHKRLDNITEKDVYNAFGTLNVKVFTSSDDLQNQLFSENWDNSNLLMMSSGNFDGLDFDSIANKII